MSKMMDNGWFGMRIGYLLLHPWQIVGEWQRHIKWAWQRVFRGWDDRVVWSIDYYLSKNMPAWLERLRDRKAGIPQTCLPDGCGFNPSDEDMESGEAKFNGILDTMIDGFKAAQEIEDSLWPVSYNASDERFKKGMALFGEHYFNLWD